MKDLTELEHAELIHVMRYINAELDVLPQDRPPLVRIPLPLDLSDRQRTALEREYSVAGWVAVVIETQNRRLRVRFPEHLELRRGAATAAAAAAPESAADLTSPIDVPEDSPD